jgi:hypothetical protein
MKDKNREALAQTPSGEAEELAGSDGGADFR